MSDIRAVVRAVTLNLWVAGYSNGVIATSNDGQVFIPGPTIFPSGHGVNAIGWNGVDLLVAVSDHGEVSTSPDGIGWTPGTSSFGTSAIRAVFFANGIWVAVGVAAKIATSTNGIGWTQRSNPFTDAINCVTFGGGKWVAAGNAGAGATSLDGVTWTAIGSTGFGANTIQGVAYGNALFVFIGQGGTLTTSPDAITWTARTSTFGSASINAIGFLPTLFTIGGAAGGVATSADGITWTARTSGLVGDILSVANTLFAGSLQAASQAIPMLTSLSTAPTVIDPAKSLGLRSSVTVSIQDFPWADRDTDKYFRERTYDALKQGTYWGKWLARNPYYQNRVMNVYTGYLVDNVFDIRNFVRRSYLIEQISGPSNSQKVTITAKDALKLADDKRAQAPFPNTGKLLADIDTTMMTFTLAPAGVGNAEYAASGTLAIGAECMTFTRVGDVVTLTNRATDATTLDVHSAGDAVQQCVRYKGMKIQDVLYDLLVTYGNVPAGYINMTQWNDEADTWLSLSFPETVIAKPEGVTTLINELTQQFLFYIWWDEREQTIPFRAIRPATFGESVSLNDDHNFLKDSVALSEDPSKRLSEVFIFYGQVNPLLAIDRVDNYTLQQINVDLAAESAVEYGETRYQTIYSRWLKKNGATVAETLGVRLLRKYRQNPRTLTFRLDARDGAVWTGSYIAAKTRAFQDETGFSRISNLEILSAREVTPGTVFEYTAQDTFFDGRYAYFTANSGVPDYTAADDEEKATGGYFTEEDGTMSNGDQGYLFV